MTTIRIIGCLSLLIFATGAFAGDLLIRGEVNVPDGTEINFTIPLKVLEAIKTSGLSAMVNDKEHLNELVDSLIADLASMKGRDLIEIEMDGHGISVEVDEVDEDQPEEANFIQLDVSPAGENVPDIKIRIPKGIIFLCTFICNQFIEINGEELFDMIKQQIKMNLKPPISQSGCCGECKVSSCPKDDDDDDDPEELVIKILGKILKELK